MNIKIRDVDRRIRDEINSIIPDYVFDFHTHCFLDDGFDGCVPDSLKIYLPCDTESIFNKLRMFFPQRKLTGIITGWPDVRADLIKQNDYIACAAAKHNLFFLALISPRTDISYIEQIVKKKECIGFKPYKCFAKNPEDARISDYVTQKQMEIANSFGLVITLHLSKRSGIADSVNIHDILNLIEKFPFIRWNLAHCGRSFTPYYIEENVRGLEKLVRPNIYLDTSAVTDSEVFSLLFSIFGPNRIIYGSDAPVSFLRGKCVAFGYDWAFITEETHTITASFPVSPTLILYEQLRAMKKAFKKSGFKKTDIKKVFFENAFDIVKEVMRRKND